jgi:hypothetical protein
LATGKIFLQRRERKDQVCETMLNIFSHEGNANQTTMRYNEPQSKKQNITNTGIDVEK